MKAGGVAKFFCNTPKGAISSGMGRISLVRRTNFIGAASKLAFCSNPFSLSRPHLFGKMMPLVKTTRGEKVGKRSKGVELIYVNQNEFPVCMFLWKEPVEKPVENVEKFCISTAKPGFFNSGKPGSCGKLADYACFYPMARRVTETR